MTGVAGATNGRRGEPRRLTGRGVLIWLGGFFGLIFFANAVFVYLALDSWTGLEVESSYKAGQSYQSEIDAAALQGARGWQVAAVLVRAADGHASLKVTARDRDGAPLAAIVFAATLTRPTHRAEDRSVTLRDAEVGVHQGTLDNLAAGQWDLHLVGTGAEGELFRSRNRVYLKE